MLINRNRATANECGRLFKWTINWHCNEVSNFHCLLAVLLFANKFLWCLSPVPTNTILWFHFGYFAPLRRSVTVPLVHLVSLQPVFHSYKSWFNQVGCYDLRLWLTVTSLYYESLFTLHQAASFLNASGSNGTFAFPAWNFQVSSRTSDPEDCQRLPDRCQLFSMFLLHCEEIALLSDELVKHTNSTPISTIYSRPVCLQTGSGLCDAGCT